MRIGRYGIVGFLVMLGGIAIVGAVLLAARIGTAVVDVAEALRAGGCTLQIVAAEDRGAHLTSLDDPVEHNTFPPTNGKHYVWWAPWAMYREPVSQLQTVHNLEHGGIVIQYGDEVEDADISAVRSFYLGDRNALLVAPLPALEKSIALAAWTAEPIESRREDDFGQGRLAICAHFDEAAFSAFRDAYRYHGPESHRFDRVLLDPGL